METIHPQERVRIPSDREIAPPPELPLDMSRDLGSYSGYMPRFTTDFISQSNPSSPRKENNLTHPPTFPQPPTAPDVRQSNPLTLVLIGLFLVGAFVVVILAATPASCALSLCDKQDRSSLASTVYLFKPYEFTAPLKTILASLVCPFLALSFLYFIIKIITSANLADSPVAVFATHVGHTAIQFYLLLSLGACVVTIPIFILSGFAASWATAISVFFGAFPTLVAAYIALLVSTKAAPRIVTSLRTSTVEAFTIASQAAAIGPLAAHALTFACLIIAYLIVRDVRALVGYVLGSSVTALILRIVAALFSYYPGADYISRFNVNDPRHPAAPLPSAGAHLASIAALSAQMCASFTAPIVATAILGSSLPYYEGSSFALCVLNHLPIDEFCVPYGNPNEKQSIAVSLCRLENVVTPYPSLLSTESNSLFVVLPFLLGVNVTICAILTGLFSLRQVRDEQGCINPADTAPIDKGHVRPFIRCRYVKLSVSFVFASIGSAIICFVLFGGSSSFHQIHSVEIDRYRLPSMLNSSVPTDCLPAPPPNADLESNIFPSFVKDLAKYQPKDAFGTDYPSAASTAWRLFFCIEIGMLCGLCVGMVCGSLSSSLNEPSRRICIMADDGLGNEISSSLGVGLLAAVLSAIIVTLTTAICYALFRSYGIGVGAIGVLHLLAQIGMLGGFSQLTKEVRRLCDMCVEGADVKRKANVIVAAADHFDAWSKSILTTCSILGTISVAWVLVQQAGLIPSARELAGINESSNPTRHSTDVDLVDLLDAVILMAVITGIILPFVFSAVVAFSTSRVSRKMSFAIERETKSRGMWEFAEVADYEYCRAFLIRVASEESLMPVTLGLICVLCGGFCYGRRGWVGVVLGAIASGSMISFSLGIMGSRLEGMRVLKAERSENKPRDGKISEEEGSAMVDGWRWEEGSQEWISGCVSTLLLFLVSSACVGIRAMAVDARRWWSGLVVLAAWAWIMMAWMAFVVRRDQIVEAVDDDQQEVESENNLREFRVNIEASSPFYEEGPSIPRDELSPRSALRHWKVDELSDLEILLK